MIIRKDDIAFKLFLFMLFTASIPYLFFGVEAIRSGYETYGGLSSVTSTTLSGGLGGLFTYAKDICAILLIIALLFSLQTRSMKIIFGIGVVFLLGIVSLVFYGYDFLGFVVAGIRTFIFFIGTTLFCIQNREIFNSKLKTLHIVTQFCLALQTIIVALQVVGSGHINSFGSGAYRFSGLFAGSGNLGCYCVAIYLFIMTLRIKYKQIPMWLVMINSIQMLFLVFASGTRTCEFLLILFVAIMVFQEYGERLHLSNSIIAVIAVVCAMIFGPSIFNGVISWTGRGALANSGSGRIEKFMDMFNSANFWELLFGKGLGVGTNASVTMSLSGTQVSDSTLNLLFTQFGMIGLIGISLALIYALYILHTSNWEYRAVSWCFIIACIVFFFVGNLFEHIAMCIYLVLTYFLIYIPNEESVYDEYGDVVGFSYEE